MLWWRWKNWFGLVFKKFGIENVMWWHDKGWIYTVWFKWPNFNFSSHVAQIVLWTCKQGKSASNRIFLDPIQGSSICRIKTDMNQISANASLPLKHGVQLSKLANHYQSSKTCLQNKTIVISAFVDSKSILSGKFYTICDSNGTRRSC